MIVAGNGTAGSELNLLFFPVGIFVDIDFNLYVADAGNNRIQLFRFGQLDAITMAGHGASINFALFFPTGVVVDADGYLFIVDHNNNRVVRSGPNGVRCVVGCSRQYGLGSDELKLPWGLAFDSYGNLFVTDWRNGRVQKFSFIRKSCAPSVNQPELCSSASWNSNGTTVVDNIDDYGNTSMILAGNSTAGSTSNLLSSPIGIFVDINFNLYVADAGNNRIQLFRFGQLDAITMAGHGVSINFVLDYPTGVVVDADGYLFIVDQNNNRIVRWGPNDVRCLIGCSNERGSGSDQLNFPWGLAFDSYGN
ncbi:unnamed protein product, partial [Rotaria sp. Silwood1]